MIDRDLAAVLKHPVGRGEFAALVFSGSVEALGELVGYATWMTARKFVLPDERLPATQDLARSGSCPFAAWPTDRVRPLPGVCFVLSDEGDPAVRELEARDGREHEHYVIASRMTERGLLRARLGRWLGERGTRPVVLLGYGDQGEQIGGLLGELGVEPADMCVLDDRAERQVAAGNVGFRVVDRDDSVVQEGALVCTPLTTPAAFAELVSAAHADGRPVLENAGGWNDGPDLVKRDRLRVTRLADRALRAKDSSVSLAPHGLALPVGVVREETRTVGGVAVRCLTSAPAILLDEGGAESIGVAEMDFAAPLGHLRTQFHRAFVTIAGQTNHHDAAFAILATREFLRGSYCEAVDAVLPSERREEFGRTAFERLLPRSITGRSLASPYMTACEQTALGVLARRYAGAGAQGRPIVEIGSALGGSTLLMAAATSDADGKGPRIYSIDPDVPTRGTMRAAFEEAGYLARLSQIVKMSEEAVEDVCGLAGMVGLVFIDGLHTAEASRRDFENYAPLVAPDGCVAFHDCDARHAGVFRTVAETAAGDARFAFKCMVDTIAVFERRG